jgi:hypothetical protein
MCIPPLVQKKEEEEEGADAVDGDCRVGLRA